MIFFSFFLSQFYFYRRRRDAEGVRRRSRPTTKWSDAEGVRPRSGPTTKWSDSKSRFRRRCEVEIRRKIAIWKAETLRNSISKELASDDITIATYIDFESDHFVVGRLRRRTASRSDHFVVGRLRRQTPSASRLRRKCRIPLKSIRQNAEYPLNQFGFIRL